MALNHYLFSGLVGVALAQIGYYQARLPAVVASHFDATGLANDWSSRNTFLGIYLVMIVLMIVVFALLPRWTIKRGGLGLKIPNRDYWLAPARLEATRTYFCSQMLTMGALHLLLTIVTMQLAILANLDPDRRLDAAIYWALGVYFVLLCAWLWNFFRHFRKP